MPARAVGCRGEAQCPTSRAGQEGFDHGVSGPCAVSFSFSFTRALLSSDE